MVAIKETAQDAEGKPVRKLRQMAEKLVDLAIQGDVGAIREVADRIDGKPTQAVEHSGDMTIRHEQALDELE